MAVSSTAVSSTFVSADGDGYELQMGRWSRRLAPLLIDFAGIDSGAHVLDVGCGTGSLAFTLARNPAIGRVTGIDFSPAYVDYARRRNADARVDFRTGDACALPFETASFDHAAAMLVLQFVPRAEDAAREMRRVTRPGGTVAAVTWDSRNLVMMRIVLDTAAVIDPDANARRARYFVRPMTRPGELAQAWRDIGLVDVVDGTLAIRMDFASFADFWRPCEGHDGALADYVRTLDAAAKAKLHDLVQLAYLDGEPDGPRSYTATAWAVRGRVPE
ncbi:class I SAM-dependent methyltransferase [Enhydrobacter sp.]|jgi:SAM-dependent methyltransferase|uniref:class I SAM-dependent methyltransferase n=1 Tax=Enhydrobacter sp. TaxID=1894999 RepID=UPI00262193CB|nr:class I SAM-dependent methyltransferase [Enhydrobacter sp.]WIM09226.1 MAG: SAM-dependent methyltransferase [Enhydrobacter sp.]